jgi:two-component system phosphate regulon sensor histidine kinase PhoR
MTERIIQHNALAALVRGMRDAVIVIDRDRNIRLANPTVEDLFGLTASEIVGTRLDDYPVFQSLVTLAQWAIFSGEPAREQIALSSGKTVWIHLLVAPDFEAGVPRLSLGIPHPNDGEPVDPMREIVHDLKVRIASAKGFIDLVGASGDLNDKQRGFAQRALLSLESMLSQVHEILDMTWLDAGGALNLVETDLARLVRHAVSHLEGYAHHSNVEMVLDLPPDGCLIEGDERRLESAISNLVGNAIKYSPNGGPVRVSVETEDNAAVFRVVDSGVGIPAEHIPRLFQRFYRVRTADTRRIEGSGLGLAIVKEIVEKHGGQVFVLSAPGQGSVFGFSLPLPPL